MNEFLRLLRRGLKPFGYDVRSRRTYTLRPLANAEAYPGLIPVTNAFERDQQPVATTDLGTLTVWVRTCLSAGRLARREQPFTGVSFAEHLCRCLYSTVLSINDAVAANPGFSVKVMVLDDRSAPHARANLERLCRTLVCPWQIATTAEPGQGASLVEQFTRARSTAGLHYFIEDDYLHERGAVREMWAFYRQIYTATGSHLVLHPQETETLFHDAYYPSYLVLGASRRWRTMSHATHSLFVHGDMVDKYWSYFENTRHVGDPRQRRKGAEAQTTNRLFEHLPGFCPVPAVAVHLQAPATLPPFYDWRALWDATVLPSALIVD